MTSCLFVISNSPSQDYTHPDDRTLLYDMTPGFKPFTIDVIVVILVVIVIVPVMSTLTTIWTSLSLSLL